MGIFLPERDTEGVTRVWMPQLMASPRFPAESSPLQERKVLLKYRKMSDDTFI